MKSFTYQMAFAAGFTTLLAGCIGGGLSGPASNSGKVVSATGVTTANPAAPAAATQDVVKRTPSSAPPPPLKVYRGGGVH